METMSVEEMNRRPFWKELNELDDLIVRERNNAPDEVVGQILTALDKVRAGYVEARDAIEDWLEIEKAIWMKQYQLDALKRLEEELGARLKQTMDFASKLENDGEPEKVWARMVDVALKLDEATRILHRSIKIWEME
jgi:hypothetical protein